METLTTEKKEQKFRKKISWKVRILSAIPAIVMMVVIFAFSAKTAVQSAQTSDPLAELALKLYRVFGGNVLAEDQTMWLEEAGHIIRKLAHAFEYAVLSICIGIHLYAIGVRRVSLFFINVLLTALYAATDEFHQLFVEGRSGQLTDVGIDTVGAVIGAAVFLLAVTIFSAFYKKSSSYERN